MRFKRRLAILEHRYRAIHEGFPTIVFGETNRIDAEVIGATGNGKVIVRNVGEAVERLMFRGACSLRQKIIFLVYAKGCVGDTCVVFPKISPLS